MTVLGESRYEELRHHKRPVIILIWHGRIFLAPYFFRKREIMPLISPSEDGEIVAQIVSRWGYKVLRGSSSHSIVRAWGEMKKELESGGQVILVPDGPKGPNRKMKPGALKLARDTGASLVSFTFSSSKRTSLKTWDHFLIPKPFSRVVVLFGEPISVEPNLTEEDLEKERQRLEHLLVRSDSEADQYFD
jgi:lysophospholipid acyltransferase (LPLAT)-like uncharacterized protein